MWAPEQLKMGLDEKKMVVHSACCCWYSGCLLELNNNIGCASQESLLCLECDVCLRTGTPLLCCGCCALRLVDCPACCVGQYQFLCCVGGCALPKHDDVPFMLNACFISMFPKVGFCMSVKLSEVWR
ncbi:unnamed protein product [Symbiodinium natans]|uniref:Uncharacterized protein n=1 Tax=Symbiodinium natans TaxID=878477 RepID=A0A812LTX3_9DINO|nr:unnamed protein product [Symbiodinium natans]